MVALVVTGKKVFLFLSRLPLDLSQPTWLRKKGKLVICIVCEFATTFLQSLHVVAEYLPSDKQAQNSYMFPGFYWPGSCSIQLNIKFSLTFPKWNKISFISISWNKVSFISLWWNKVSFISQKIGDVEEANEKPPASSPPSFHTYQGPSAHTYS